MQRGGRLISQSISQALEEAASLFKLERKLHQMKPVGEGLKAT